MGAPVSPRRAIKASFEGEKTLKIYIFRLLFQSKDGAVRPKKIKFIWWIWNAYIWIRYIYLEVSAHALLKVATETSFSGKKSENLAFLGYFFRSKNGGVWTLFFSIILERSFLVQIHTFWKSVHEFFVHNIFVAIGSSE